MLARSVRLSYYNEHDRFAAEWLRGLVADGRIAPGFVDERDIRDVQPADLAGYVQCHFFAGIGGWSLALRLAGWDDARPVWTGSCPCQPFSSAGKRGGFADERHLWPTWFRLIRECRPAVVFGEQVASTDGLGWFDSVSTDLESEAYAVGAADIPAAGVGAPHRRQRLFFVADSQIVGCAAGRIGSANGRPTEQPIGLRDALAMANAQRGRVHHERPGAHGGAPRSDQGEGHQRKRLRPDAGQCRDSLSVADASGARPARREIAGGSGEGSRGAGGARSVGGLVEPARDGAAGALVYADGARRTAAS